MTKYLPKDSGYTQMYMINKFEKNIMENALSNMKNDQKNGEAMNALKKVSQETQTPSTQNLNSDMIPKEQEDISLSDSNNNVSEISFPELEGRPNLNKKHIQEAFNILLKQAKNVSETSFPGLEGKDNLNKKHIQEAFNILLKQAKKQKRKLKHSNVTKRVKVKKIKQKKNHKNIKDQNDSVKNTTESAFLVPPKKNKNEKGLIDPIDTETFHDWSLGQ